MEELLSDNLFLSLLSQGGANIAGEGSVAAGINPILQGVIGAQSKAKEQNRQAQLLAKLLGQGVDFTSGADGKIKIGAENMDSFASLLGDSKTGVTSVGDNISLLEGASKPLTMTKTPQAQPQKQPQGSGIEFLKSLLNPSPSPSDVPAFSDLVGLTTQDMSQALAGAQQTELLRQKIADDLETRKIKQGTLEVQKKQAGTSELKAKTDLFKAMTKDERTAAQKNYQFAKDEGFEGSFMNFQNASETTHKKDYDVAKAGGYEGSFHEWMFDMAKAGAITIGELTGREQAKGDIAGQLYFKKGDFIKDLSKHMNSEDVQNKLIAFKPADRDIEAAKEKVIFIEENIIARGGNVIDIKYAKDGKTMIWTVTWPSGDTEEIKYAIRS